MSIKVFVADITDYSAGRPTGRWFDLDHYDTPSDLLADVPHEEWAIHEHDSSLALWEISQLADLDWLFDLKRALAEHGADAVNAALAEGIPLGEINDRK